VDEHHDIPKGLDYDLWVGPVEFRHYSPLWVPWNWRGFTHFGGGTIGDWICHVVDPAFWALDLGAPSTVSAETKDYDLAKDGLTYPPATKVTFEFPAKGARGPVKLVWHDGNETIPKPEGFPEDEKIPGTGAILIGDKGMIVHGSHGAGSCHLVPDTLNEKYAGKNAPAQKNPPGQRSCLGLDRSDSHEPAGWFQFRLRGAAYRTRPAWVDCDSLSRSETRVGPQRDAVHK